MADEIADTSLNAAQHGLLSRPDTVRGFRQQRSVFGYLGISRGGFLREREALSSDPNYAIQRR